MQTMTIDSKLRARDLGRRRENAYQCMHEQEVRNLSRIIREWKREFGAAAVQEQIEIGEAEASQRALREQVRRFGHNYMG